MDVTMFSRLWQLMFGPPLSRNARARRPRLFQPRLEAFEDRVVPSASLAGWSSPSHANAPAAIPGVITATFLGNQQQNPASASWSGGTVIVWNEPNPSNGGLKDIKGEILDTNGMKKTPFTVANTAANEHDPAVAVDANGNFVVAWTKDISSSSSDQDVLIARFDANGNKLSSPLSGSVAGTSAKIENHPSVAMAANGDFVVSYTQEVIAGTTGASQTDITAADYVQVSPGVYSSTPKVLNVANSSTLNEIESSVARQGGTFVIGFITLDPTSNSLGTLTLKSYTELDITRPTRVDLGTAGKCAYPSVAINSSGTVAAAWQQKIDGNLTIRASELDSTLTPISVVLADGSSTTVMPITGVSATDFTLPSLALNADGSFVVAFQEGLYGNSTHVKATDVTLTRTATGRIKFAKTTPLTDFGSPRVTPSVCTQASGKYAITFVNATTTAANFGVNVDLCSL